MPTPRAVPRRPVKPIAALAALVVVASSLVAGGASPASATEVATFPSSGNVGFHDNGNGHGHGLSQYGARGAAIAGLSSSQILAFYYPGTTLGTATGHIRVLISADNDNDVPVLPASGLKVRNSAAVTTGKADRSASCGMRHRLPQ